MKKIHNEILRIALLCVLLIVLSCQDNRYCKTTTNTRKPLETKNYKYNNYFFDTNDINSFFPVYVFSNDTTKDKLIGQLVTQWLKDKNESSIAKSNLFFCFRLQRYYTGGLENVIRIEKESVNSNTKIIINNKTRKAIKSDYIIEALNKNLSNANFWKITNDFIENIRGGECCVHIIELKEIDKYNIVITNSNYNGNNDEIHKLLKVNDLIDSIIKTEIPK